MNFGKSINLISKWVFLIVLLLVNVIDTYSQNHEYIHFTTKEGLPTNKLYDITQDNEGFMWISTQNGVSKYDGHAFENLTLDDGLYSNDVFKIMEAANGNMLCFSFGDSLTTISNNRMKVLPFKYTHPTLSKNGNRTYLFNSLDGYSSWSEISDGEIKVRKKKNYIDLLKRSPFSSWISPNRFVKLDVVNNRVILLDSELKEIKRKEIDLNVQECFMSGLSVVYDFQGYNFYCLNNGHILIAGKEKFILINADLQVFEGGFKELGFNELIFSGDLQMSFVDNTIQIHQWGSGIVTFNSNFEIIDSFFYNKEIQNVNNARIDQERNIWITTIDNGLYYLPATKRQIITEPIGNYKEYTYPFSYYKYKNVLYTGTNYSGIFGNSRAILLPNEKLPRHIIDIIQLKDKLIFGGVNFSFILDQKVRDLREYKATIKSSSPNLKLNNLGTGGIFNNAKAICKLDENSFFYSNRYSTFKATFNTSNEIDVWEISPNKSYAMVYEKGKGLWMGAERGLYFWDEKKDSIYRVLCDEVDFTINKLEIRNGILWIGSNGLGLWALNIKNRSIKRVPRLKGTNVTDLFISQENIWIASNKGVETLIETGGKYKLGAYYNSTNVLPSDEVNCIWVDEEYLYAGTRFGTTTIPYKEQSNGISKNPMLHIKEFKSKERQFTNFMDEIELNRHDNSVQLTFTSPFYTNGEPLKFWYQLKGYSKEWDYTTNTILKFNKLPFGDYELTLFAEKPNGQKSKYETIFFCIAPAFWQTWWFWSFIGLAIGVLIYLLIKRREKKYLIEIQKEATLNSRFGELELKALQAQMNPHFVFNALGSIQQYMSTNVELAEQYISKFALLMRLFLESSKSKYNTLEQEVKLIRLYVGMEKMRFLEKFDYKIEVDEKLDTFIDSIPTMIVQPFVENAINHGLFHKKGKGNLEISFVKVDKDFFKVIIQDDGIGRKKANEINDKKASKHKSRAMEIVTEKLDVMHKMGNVELSFNIKDLEDQDGNSIGTLVEIKVPFN